MKYFTFFTMGLLCAVSYGQQFNPRFIEYLSAKGYHEEVIFLTSDEQLLSTQAKDSILYFRGWSFYNLKQLENSSLSLDQVSDSSPFYFKSKFFSIYNQIHLGNYNHAKSSLSDLDNTPALYQNLKFFQLSAVSLLEKDFNSFRDQINRVDTNYFAFRTERSLFEEYAKILAEHRKKSPVLAGLMSAIVPGSGKMYAGKTSQGISSFIATAGLGLVTFENYRKLGLTNYKTIFFGTAFTVFYIANIYGAVFSVKIAETEFQNEYRNKIVYHLHIPLRTIFN
jgi:hypothetical protein